MGHEPAETPVAAEFQAARDGVEHWRRTRTTRGRMPEPLWQAAVELARTTGVFPTARALHIDCGALKCRLIAATREAALRAGQADPAGARAPAGFVQLAPLPLPPAPSPLPAGPIVELSDPDGTTLTLRLPPGDEHDLAGLVGALWGTRR